MERRCHRLPQLSGAGTILIVPLPFPIELLSTPVLPTPRGGPAFSTDPLAPGERLCRIGEILYRAACRSHIGKAERTRHPVSDLSQGHQKILGAIRGLESAAPEQLIPVVQMSRASLARGLRALLAQGFVVRTGMTRQARYSLSRKQRNMVLGEIADQQSPVNRGDTRSTTAWCYRSQDNGGLQPDL
jgi:DNA-binding MarR family transcriptional regulator